MYEYYAHADSYEELHARTRACREKWEQYIPDTSFKFNVLGYNQSIPQRRQREVVEAFSYMDFRGKIEMKNPDATFAVFEECA